MKGGGGDIVLNGDDFINCHHISIIQYICI